MESARKRLQVSALLGLLAGAALAGCTTRTETPVETPAAPFEILSPGPGDALYTNRMARVLARLSESALKADPLHVRVTATGEDGKAAVIAEGDLRTEAVSDVAEAGWILDKVKPGPYEITVAVGAGKGVERRSVPVEVRRPPDAEIVLTELRHEGKAAIATLLAKPRTPSGTPIAGYVWTPEDAAVPYLTETPSFTYRFPDYARPATVSLRVFDVAGGSNLIVRTLPMLAPLPQNPQRPPLKAPAPFCGCKSMVIRRTPGDLSGVYCFKPPRGGRLPPGLEQCVRPPPRTLTFYSDLCRKPGYHHFVCPLGSVSPFQRGRRMVEYFGFGFEADAELIDGSTHAKCEEGQIVRGSLYLNGARQPVKNPMAKKQPPQNTTIVLPRAHGAAVRVKTVKAGKRVPPLGGPNWGSDAYTRPWELKGYDPKFQGFGGPHIHWLDAPGLATNKQPGNPPINAAHDTRELIAYVLGSPNRRQTNSCWCQFTIDHQWVRGRTPPVTWPGNRAEPIKLIAQENCRLQ